MSDNNNNNNNNEAEDQESNSGSDASSTEDLEEEDDEGIVTLAENLFGKECYLARVQDLPTPEHWETITYRDSGCLLIVNAGAVTYDSQIVSRFLSLLTLDELNAVDMKVRLQTVGSTPTILPGFSLSLTVSLLA